MAHRTSLNERHMIYQMSHAGISDPEIAQRLGWSRSVVRKWRLRGQKGGVGSLQTVMGRPASGVLNRLSPLVAGELERLRRKHPGWGAKTLRTELILGFGDGAGWIPSQSSLHRWLRAKGLVKPYHKHTTLPMEAWPHPVEPHQVWELDARGQERVAELGLMSLINIKDVASRAYIMSQPCGLETDPGYRRLATSDYQLALRRAFTEWGLPDVITVDHDSIFIENGSASPFPTRLHLWLLALGISLWLIGLRRPTQHAIVERSHQTFFRQVLQGQNFTGLSHLETVCDQRRSFLNRHLGCRSLQEQPPLQARPDAQRPRRLYRPEYEADLLDLSRVWHYLQRGHWFRTVSQTGTVSLGGSVYCLPRSWARRDLEITFRASDQRFIFDPDSDSPEVRPVRGISLDSLMGDLSRLAHGSPLQLLLPFSWEQIRLLRLSETLCDTT
jgi:transposase